MCTSLRAWLALFVSCVEAQAPPQVARREVPLGAHMATGGLHLPTATDDGLGGVVGEPVLVTGILLNEGDSGLGDLL